MEIFNNLVQILPNIFYKIVYMSLIASIIGTIILIINKIFKNKISSKWKSRLWIIFIIMLIVPINIASKISIYNFLPIEIEGVQNTPIIVKEEYKEKTDDFTREIKSIPKSGIEAIEKETDANTKLSIINGYSNAERFIKNKQQYDVSKMKFTIINIVFPILWGIIVILLIVIYMISYIEFSKKMKANNNISDRMNEIFKKAKLKSKVKKNIKLVNQEYICMPSIFGILNIRILINDKLESLEDKEIEYIFMHELAHYKRKDNLLNFIITILKYIYFFNPIIHILIKSLRKDMELSCDEIAVSLVSEGEKKEYCRTLVHMAKEKKNKVLEGALCITDDKSNLENRINNIKLSKKFKKYKAIISIFSILIIFTIIPLFCTTRYGIITKIRKEILSRYGEVDSFYIKRNYYDYYNNESRVYYTETLMKNGEMNICNWSKESDNKTFLYYNFSENVRRLWIESEKKENKFISIDYGIGKFDGIIEYFGHLSVDLKNNNFFTQMSERYELEKKSKAISLNIDGKMCYKITIKENEEMYTDLYIDKETYLPIKEVMYEIEKEGEVKELNKIEYEIQINQNLEKEIINPNLDEFEYIQINDLEETFEEASLDNIEIKSISNTNQKPGEALFEEFDILETEELDLRYFIKTGTELRDLKVPSFRIYEKITEKWSNLRKLTKEDFKYYDVYIVINVNKNKTLKFKEKIYTDGDYCRNILFDIRNKNEENNNYQAELIVVKKEDKSNISYNFCEAKNEILFKSEKYALDKGKENMDKILEAIENYTNIDATNKLSNSGGFLRNVIPNEFWISNGKSIKETSIEERTAWEEIYEYRDWEDDRNFELHLYIDTETGEFISGKILFY